MPQILIVEDNSTLRHELRDLLLSRGYTVFCSCTRTETLYIIQTETIHLCLMDVGLPDCSGFDLCKEMRKYYTKSIVMLTAYDQEEDIVQGFACGADDYVTKPFSIRILLSRVEAQLRTAQRQAVLPEILHVGNLQFHFKTCQVIKNGQPVNLGKVEFDILKILLKSSGRIVERSYLLTHIWDTNEKYIEDNTLSVHISRIRKYLGTYHGEQYIETVKNRGYRWSVLPGKNEVALW